MLVSRARRLLFGRPALLALFCFGPSFCSDGRASALDRLSLLQTGMSSSWRYDLSGLSPAASVIGKIVGAPSLTGLIVQSGNGRTGFVSLKGVVKAQHAVPSRDGTLIRYMQEVVVDLPSFPTFLMLHGKNSVWMCQNEKADVIVETTDIQGTTRKERKTADIMLMVHAPQNSSNSSDRLDITLRDDDSPSGVVYRIGLVSRP